MEAAVQNKLRDFNSRRLSLCQDLVRLARGLVPVLKDHSLANTAKPLEEVLFQLDALDQESVAFFKENIDVIMGAIRGE